MSTVNLGKVRDFITGVSKISSNGNVDTYKLVTSSGAEGLNFQVTNGINGMVIHSYNVSSGSGQTALTDDRIKNAINSILSVYNDAVFLGALCIQLASPSQTYVENYSLLSIYVKSETSSGNGQKTALSAYIANGLNNVTSNYCSVNIIYYSPSEKAESSSTSLTIDTEISSTSENAVQNKVIYNELQGKQNTLISKRTIKQVNGVDLLGSGSINTNVPNGVIFEADSIAQKSELDDLLSKAPLFTLVKLQWWDNSAIPENLKDIRIDKEHYTFANVKLSNGKIIRGCQIYIEIIDRSPVIGIVIPGSLIADGYPLENVIIFSNGMIGFNLYHTISPTSPNNKLYDLLLKELTRGLQLELIVPYSAI